MRKRRIRRAMGFSSPFGLYMDMWKAGMQAAEMMGSSAEVIFHRSQMMQQSLSGKLPMDHKEYTRMWQEKKTAAGEAWLASMRHAGKATGHSLMPGERQLQSQLKGMMETMKPYSSKAKANARRLRRTKK